MGNLEKAGVGVVVALLLIIMVVAFTTDPQTNPTSPEDPREETALEKQRRSDSADPNAEINSNDPTTRPLEVDQDDPERDEPTTSGVGEELEGPDVPTADPNERERPVNPGPTTTEPTTVEPKAQPAPVGAWPKEVVAKPNDSLWRIAARSYGRNFADRMVPVLRKHNALKSDVLQLDQKLSLPAPPAGSGGGERVASAGGTGGAERPATTPPTRPASSGLPWEPGPASYGAESGPSGDGWYVVKQNESLSQIAQKQLGSVKFMKDIIKLNGIKNPDRILAGTRLKLPAKDKR